MLGAGVGAPSEEGIEIAAQVPSEHPGIGATVRVPRPAVGPEAQVPRPAVKPVGAQAPSEAAAEAQVAIAKTDVGGVRGIWDLKKRNS